MLRYNFQLKLAGLFFFSALFTFFFVSNVAAQRPNKLVETIDILGNRRLSDEEILQHIKTRPGDRFDEKQVQQDLQSILNLGQFDKTQTRVLTEEGLHGGVNVIFEVMEVPIIAKLNFDGLRYVTKEELLAVLREQKIEITAKNPYQSEKLQKAQRLIAEYLVKKRGFADAKVSVSTEVIPATTVIVSFVIDELPNDDEDNREQ